MKKRLWRNLRQDRAKKIPCLKDQTRDSKIKQDNSRWGYYIIKHLYKQTLIFATAEGVREHGTC